AIIIAGSGKVWGNVRSTQAGVAISGASKVTGNATAGTTVSRSGGGAVGGTITNNAQLKVDGPVVIKLTGTLKTGQASRLSNTTGIPGNLRILSSFSGANGV